MLFFPRYIFTFFIRSSLISMLSAIFTSALVFVILGFRLFDMTHGTCLARFLTRITESASRLPILVAGLAAGLDTRLTPYALLYNLSVVI